MLKINAFFLQQAKYILIVNSLIIEEVLRVTGSTDSPRHSKLGPLNNLVVVWVRLSIQYFLEANTHSRMRTIRMLTRFVDQFC
jgi:hypothetical protein